MPVRRYDRAARAIIQRVPPLLQVRGLEPAFTDWVLIEDRDMTVLFGVLDVRRVKRMEDYTTPALLHHLSAALDGLPIVTSNSNGLRYGIILSGRPRLPKSAAFPGHQRGQVLLGVTGRGLIALQWEQLGHVLAAGMTGSGKSMFLRLIVHQALAEGYCLALSDVGSATFPMLAHHPGLIAPLAKTPDEASCLVHEVLTEMNRRDRLYQAAPGFPENLHEYNRTAGEKLPDLLVVLDEYNATALQTGGVNGEFAQGTAQIAFGGRKWGVHLVVAGHEFQRSVVGPISGQLITRFCFRVESPSTSRLVIGDAGATHIPASRPGRALTRRWGMVQTYLIDKQALIASPGVALTEDERRIAQFIRDHTGGLLSVEGLKAAGMPERRARQLIADWDRRQWAALDKRRNNGRYLQSALLNLLEAKTA